MSVPLPVSIGERRIVGRLGTTVAARFEVAPDGHAALTVNDELLALPGGMVFAEMWARLNLVRGRQYDVLSMQRARVAAPFVQGQHFEVPA